MRIEEVAVTALRVPLNTPKRFALRTVGKREYTVVQVTTDEGLTGWGYVWGPAAVAVLIRDLLVELLLDEDPRRIEYLWDRMYRSTLVWGRRGLLLRAISAVDVALWDLFGKITGQPLHLLLGGYRHRAAAYYSGGYYLPGFTEPAHYLEYLEKEVTRLFDMGFTAYKMKIGAASPEVDLMRVSRAREMLGDGKLMLDANCAWDADEALRMAQIYSEFEPEWLEEPVSPDDIGGYQKLVQGTDIPIAVGENHFTRWEFEAFLANRAADILQGDPTIMGGITEYIKLHGMASTAPVRLAPHNSHNINVHVGAGMSGVEILEYFDPDGDVFNFHTFMKNPVEPVAGHLVPHDAPGHGLELDRRALDRFAL